MELAAMDGDLFGDVRRADGARRGRASLVGCASPCIPRHVPVGPSSPRDPAGDVPISSPSPSASHKGVYNNP